MAKLISSLEVIEKALIMGNIDPSLITDFYIEIAQEEFIRPVLTQDLYDLVVSEKNANVFTDSNETLLNDYIKPCLAFYVACIVVPHIAVRITNKGVVINTAETSQFANREERNDLIAKLKSHGDTLSEKMVRYLSDNTTIFTLFANGSSDTLSGTFKAGIIM